MKVLYINTSIFGEIKVRLIEDSGQVEKVSKQQFGSQALLNLIDQVLSESKTAREELVKIEVNTGPGSFTGIKVGVAVANALGFSLGIPVNGKKIETDLKYA